jgi:hypothetical protein
VVVAAVTVSFELIEGSMLFIADESVVLLAADESVMGFCANRAMLLPINSIDKIVFFILIFLKVSVYKVFSFFYQATNMPALSQITSVS